MEGSFFKGSLSCGIQFMSHLCRRMAQAKIIGEENGQFTIDNSKLKILSDAS